MGGNMADPRVPINLTLSEEAILMCARLQRTMGINRSAVIELAVREFADKRDRIESAAPSSVEA